MPSVDTQLLLLSCCALLGSCVQAMEITTDMITQFGLMNKVSTGHQWLDIAICLAIPYLLQTWAPKIYEFLGKLFKPSDVVDDTKTFKRTITFVNKPYYWWGNSDEPPNNILQQAILAYLNRQPDLSLKLEDANVELAEQPKKKIIKRGDSSSGDDDEETESGETSEVQRYGVSVVPPIASWVEVEPGLEFMREEEFSTPDNEGSKRKLKTLFHFRTFKKDGNKLIDAYIKAAFDFYKDQRKEVVDRARYMYMPVSKAKPDEAAKTERAATVYKRYKLSEDKTFASLFHPDRDHILKLISDFKVKGGKFAIPGYPQKLGFLLYGPPGTGKTTFIKALAQVTGRHIISVPLAKIQTNQELMDVMFENTFRIEGQDLPISMNFSKVLYVMEDVDAACNVVNRRTDPTKMTTTTVKVSGDGGLMVRSSSTQAEDLSTELPPISEDDSEVMGPARHYSHTGYSPFQIHAHAGYPGGITKDGKDKKDEKDGKEKKEGKDSKDGKGGKDKGFGKDDDLPLGLMMGMGKYGKGLGGIGGGYMGFMAGPDELNLAGLLNVLDGVVDTPDRLVVMTTNHPEKLDPALVRPGRINKKIFMGRMRINEALQMMRHYFQVVSEADEAAVRAAFVDDKWSPAELESMCAEYDSVQELVDALAKLVAETGTEPVKA